jgi:hypothetical protein
MNFIEQSQKNMKDKTDVLETKVSTNFIEQSKKNTKKYSYSSKEIKKIIPLLKEVTAAAGAAGFTGAAGGDVDQLFAGPFHPVFGQIIDLLGKQLEDRDEKIKDTDSKEVNPVGGWFDADTESNRLAYEELLNVSNLIKQFNIDVTPLQDIDWQSTGVDIEYDNKPEYYADKDFVNVSNKNVQINTDIKYDDIYTHIDNEEDFINQSQTNMKHIGEDEDYVDESDTSLKTIYKNDIGVSISFDDEEDEEYDDAAENFINRSQINMKTIDVGIKYDSIPNYYAGENFINKSKTNWKLVGRK